MESDVKMLFTTGLILVISSLVIIACQLLNPEHSISGGFTHYWDSV